VGETLLHQLTPNGSLLARVTPRKVGRVMDTAEIEMVLAMRAMGWKRVDDYKLHHTAPKVFAETVYHFSPTTRPAMYQETVKVPIGNWAKKRLAKLGKNDTQRRESAVGSGFGVDMSGWVGKELVYPSNVLMVEGELAVWAWFIKLFSVPGDVVGNPFQLPAITTTALSLRRQVQALPEGAYQLAIVS